MEHILKLGGKIIRSMKKNKFTNKIKILLYNKTGLWDFLYRNRYNKRKEHMKERIDTINLFEKNKDIIENNTNLLSDEKSKYVYRQLIMYRCYRFRKDMKKVFTNDQYFPKGIINLSDDEVYLDVGAFDGRTALLFAKKTKNHYKKIICFEPDSNNYKKVINNTKKLKNIEIINKGLYSEAKTMCFKNSGTSLARISNDGEYKIKADRLDKINSCKDASFIKMDIEGAEMEALKGAESIIKKNKPKLAICIYHSDEDMVRIIDYIHKLVPEYKLYVRHHGCTDSETVLYAVL